VRARIAAYLYATVVADGEGLDARSALDEFLHHVDAVRRAKRTLFPLGADGGLGHPHAVVPHALLRPQAEAHLVRDGNVDGIALCVGAVLAGLRGRRREGDAPSARTARARARERGRTSGRFLRPCRRETPIAGESPRSVDQDAHADALGLAVCDRVNLTVLGGDVLDSPRDRARVGVARPRAQCSVDRVFAEFAHGRED
jgi:hypothetical protein